MGISYSYVFLCELPNNIFTLVFLLAVRLMDKSLSLSLFLFLFFFFLGPHLQHMEVPRLGAKSELQLPAYTTTTATQDPSHIFDLHHSSRQRWIPNPLKEDRD